MGTKSSSGGGEAKKRLKVLAARIPTNVERPVAINVVGKIAAGSADSKLDLNPIIPVGNNASPDVLIAKNKAIAFVAVP